MVVTSSSTPDQDPVIYGNNNILAMLCSQGGFYTIPNFLFLFSFSLYSLSAGLSLSCIPQHSQKIFLVIKWFVMFIKSVAFPHITPLPLSTTRYQKLSKKDYQREYVAVYKVEVK